MPRPRLIVTALVVGLLAASCGGGDASSQDDLADSEPGVEAAPEVEQSPEQSQSPETAPEATQPEVEQSPETAPEATQPEVEQSPELSPSPETAPEATQPESRAEPVRVVLGDRFEWCAGVQERWDRYVDRFEAAVAASEALSDAVAAHAAATDELDKAEATAALEDAQYVFIEAASVFERSADYAIGPLLQSADPEVSERDDIESIALARAWEAFVSRASPEEVALVQLPPPEGLSNRSYPRDPSWYDEVRRSWEESWLPPRWETDRNLGADRLNEMASAALAAAAEFDAQAVSLIAEAAAARDALQDALVAATLAAAASDAASAAIAAEDLGSDLVFALGRATAVVSMMQEAILWSWEIAEVADEAGAGVDPGLLENAELLLADADAAGQTIEEIRDDLSSLEDPSTKEVAYHKVLLHSAAYAAFARSLGESCRQQ